MKIYILTSKGRCNWW